MSKPMSDARWQKLIREARGYYFKGNKHRMRVAELAIEACQILHGGDRDRRYTVVRFAREIGMHSKTLHGWISVNRQIVDKVPASVVKGLSYDKLKAVLGKVDLKSSSREVTNAIKEIKGKSPVDARFNKYIKVLKTILHNAKTPIKLMEVSDQQITQIINYSELIKKFYSKEMEYRTNGLSGAKAKALDEVKRFNKAVASVRGKL